MVIVAMLSVQKEFFLENCIKTTQKTHQCFQPHVGLLKYGIFAEKNTRLRSLPQQVHSCSPHPNISVFIDALMNIPTDTHIKINSASLNLPTCKNKVVRKRQQYLNNKINRLCKVLLL